MSLWLSEKYLHEISSSLGLFKKLRHGLYNCRCPICGDSDKDKTKKRGYFYVRENKMYYKCHNCNASQTFSTFLKNHDPETYKRYRVELFQEKHGSKKKVESEDVTMKNLIDSYKKITPDLLRGIKKVSDLDDDHIAVKYLRGRMIPEERFSEIYYVDRITDITSRLEKYKDKQYDDVPRVVLVSLNESGEVIKLAFRAIKDSDLRYVTISTSDEDKVFGIDKIDKSKTVYVVEGQFDSMFLPNCIAMGGSDINSNVLSDIDDVVFVYDNEKRNKHITRTMKKVIKAGYGLVLWGDIEGKDINKMIENGYSQEYILDHIKKNTYYGLKAELKLAEYTRL